MKYVIGALQLKLPQGPYPLIRLWSELQLWVCGVHLRLRRGPCHSQ